MAISRNAHLRATFPPRKDDDSAESN